jgi:hypothetical protein
MNLAQYYNRFYRDLGEINTNRFPMDLINEWFIEAQDLINNKTLTLRKTKDYDIVADQRLYALPTDMEPFQIDEVWSAISSDPTYLLPLEKTDVKEVEHWNPMLWRTISGVPINWYIDHPQTNQFGLYRIPSFNTTAGLRIYYRGKQVNMTRYYSTGTVTVVNGSATVTGSGTTFVGNVVAGDEFGVGVLMTSGTSFPQTWYTVKSVDSNTQLTLTTNYAGAGAATQSYICAATSAFDSTIINYACIMYATGIAKLKDKEYELAGNIQAAAIQKAVDEAIHIGSWPMPVIASHPVGTMSQTVSGIFDYGER